MFHYVIMVYKLSNNSMLTDCLTFCLFQVTRKGSLVERHAKGTGMMSGWGSVWQDKTNPMEEFWYVLGGKNNEKVLRWHQNCSLSVYILKWQKSL